MATDNQEVKPGVTQFFDSLKVLGKYISTPAGIGSTVPGVLSIADVGLGFLPFSSPVRPAIYFFVFMSVLFAFYYECAQYSMTRANSEEFPSMGRRAAVNFVVGIILCAAYLPILALIDDYAPRSENVLFVWLWAAALSAAVGIMGVTRALVILGMKTFIAHNRTGVMQ